MGRLSDSSVSRLGMIFGNFLHHNVPFICKLELVQSHSELIPHGARFLTNNFPITFLNCFEDSPFWFHQYDLHPMTENFSDPPF